MSNEIVRNILKRLIPQPYREKLGKTRKQLCDLYYLKWRTPILVYQMGKVGSLSVYESLLACDVKALHLHEMEAPYMREIARKDQVRIISLVREPIGRHISDFFQNFELHTGVAHDQAAFDPATLSKIFLDKKKFWRPSSWFDREMKTQLGIDVYDYPFPQEKGYLLIKQGKYEILILKLELDDTIKEKVISEFLGLDNFELIRKNVAQDKTYAKTYREFKNALRLPEQLIEAMCNARYTRHFYSHTEIEAMRAKYERPHNKT
ncbi:MAG: hypothetical protein GY833_06775 [Aestuariibacter sp.]|nr:hypothetical protein [Aestuariibacter sp.]